MLWLIAIAIVAAASVAAWRLWRHWVQPWREIERLVHEVVAGQQPRTFLVDGNDCAQRVGIALEDVFLRQRDLARRGDESVVEIDAILGAMRDGLAVINADGSVRILNAALRRLFAVSDNGTPRYVMETFRDAAVAELVRRSLRTGETGTATINVRNAATVDRRVAV